MISKIEQEYLDARQEHWEALKNLSSIKDYKEFQKQIKPYLDKVMEKSRNFRMVKSPKLEPIPDYGDLMTLNNFIECVNDGGFIDYDGHGYYSDGKNITDIIINPSDVKHNSIRKDFSYVVWFNR